MPVRNRTVKESKAFRTFHTTIERSLNLITVHKALSKLAAQTQDTALGRLELADLVRAAVMLAVAAMDSYFTDVFAEKLVAFLKRCETVPDRMIEILSQAGFDTKAGLEMLRMQRPHRRIRTLLEAYFEKYTTQKFDVVDKLFLAYGIKGFSKNAQKAVKRRNLLERVRRLIQRRHEIVHGGDLNDHGHLRHVDPLDIRKRIEDLYKLVGGAEKVLDAQLR